MPFTSRAMDPVTHPIIAACSDEVKEDWPAHWQAYLNTKVPSVRRVIAAIVQTYDGVAERTAKELGISAPTVHRYLGQVVVREMIAARCPSVDFASKVATREERQAYWTDVMRDETQPTVVRLKAAELLGKSQCDFVDKHIIDANVKTLADVARDLGAFGVEKRVEVLKVEDEGEDFLK